MPSSIKSWRCLAFMADYIEKDAVLSKCGKYRYRLRRRWDSSPVVVFAMLNPSTADHEKDDPTIRKCVGFAKHWGFGAIEIINLFAIRSSSPDDVMKASDPVGENNWVHVQRCLTSSYDENMEWEGTVLAGERLVRYPLWVICAWGAHGRHMGQDQEFLGWVDQTGVDTQLRCLGLTKKGLPRHPLYVPYTQEPDMLELDEPLLR